MFGEGGYKIGVGETKKGPWNCIKGLECKCKEEEGFWGFKEKGHRGK